MSSTPHRIWLRRTRFVLGLAGLCFAMLAFRATFDQVGDELNLSPGLIALAVLLAMAAAAAAAIAWSLVVESDDRKRLRSIYFSALIGKYIPGGVFQAAGQISMTAEMGLGLGRSTSGWIASMIAAVASGMIATGGLAFVPQFDWVVRVMGAGGFVVGILLVVVPWTDALLSVLRRRSAGPASGGFAPKRLLTGAVFLNLLGLCALALAYAVSVRLFASDYSVAVAAAAFAASWIVGFLAVPFPSGIGVREGVLAGLLGPFIGVGAALGASLVTRLAAIAAELMLFAYGSVSRKHLAGSRSQAPPLVPSDQEGVERDGI